MNIRPWLFLLAAIVTEISSVTVMKLVSETGSWTAFGFMYVMIGLSFLFLGWAVTSLPIATAYATWETVGLIAVTFIGYRFFGEPLGMPKLSGIALLLTGVLLVNTGVPKPEA